VIGSLRSSGKPILLVLASLVSDGDMSSPFYYGQQRKNALSNTSPSAGAPIHT